MQLGAEELRRPTSIERTVKEEETTDDRYRKKLADSEF